MAIGNCLQVIRTSELTLAVEPYIYPTMIDGLLLIKRPLYSDERGSFQELVRIPDISNYLGRPIQVQNGQMQQSMSKMSVIRGIHAESQDKIVVPQSGLAMSVYVDLRIDSETRGQYVKVIFDNRNPDTAKTSVFVPNGIGNSIAVWEGSLLYSYAVTKVYSPELSSMGISIFDPDLAIDWGIESPVISIRDTQLSSLRDEYPAWFIAS